MILSYVYGWIILSLLGKLLFSLHIGNFTKDKLQKRGERLDGTHCLITCHVILTLCLKLYVSTKFLANELANAW